MLEVWFFGYGGKRFGVVVFGGGYGDGERIRRCLNLVVVCGVDDIRNLGFF